MAWPTLVGLVKQLEKLAQCVANIVTPASAVGNLFDDFHQAVRELLSNPRPLTVEVRNGYVCVCVYAYVRMCVCVCAYVYVYVRMCVCVGTRTC